MANLTEHVILNKWDNDINDAIVSVGGNTQGSVGLPDYAKIIKKQLVARGFTPTPEPCDYQLPIASTEVLGGVKVGDGLDIDDDGKLGVNIGTGLFIDDGKLGLHYATLDDIDYMFEQILNKLPTGGSGYELPTASDTTLGIDGVSCGYGLKEDNMTQSILVDIDYIYQQILAKLQKDGHIQ